VLESVVYVLTQKFVYILEQTRERERARIPPSYVAEPTRIVVIRVVVGLGRKRDDAKKARKKRIYIYVKKKLAFRSLFCSVLRTGLRPKDLNITPSNVNART
jgi:hypothetical protein